MTLTLGTGPLAPHPGGTFNFDLDAAPKHRIFFEAYPRRLRAVIGDRVVLDTTRGHLLHETAIPPVPYAPLEDFDASVLERRATSTHCPFKGDASYWSIRVGDRVVADAVWTYEQPLEAAAWLEGHAALYWDKADAWFVEEERVYGRLRDPYHRVDVFESSRPVTVRVGGQVVAHSERPKLLFETGLPARVYVPPADIVGDALAPSETRTVCPYKGEASYWTVRGNGTTVADGGWSYEAPLPEALKVQGRVAFMGDGVEVEIGAPRGEIPGQAD
jgi:uncharacterized protein (DUF427 family)